MGLVTIKPKKNTSFFKKGIHTIPASSVFIRIGSNTTPTTEKVERNTLNTATVTDIENNARNNIKYTLDGVFDFINFRHKDMAPKYHVFKELFIICWAGIPKRVHHKTYLSRVDIELINEQVKLFYSAQDVVTIDFDENSFTITEFVPLGLNDKTSYYPLEKQTIYFYENGYYKIESEMLFEPPKFNKKMLFHIYNANIALLKKLEKGMELTEREHRDLENLPSTFMICYLNGFEEAKEKLINAKQLLKPHTAVYSLFKEALRILRKMKYNTKNED